MSSGRDGGNPASYSTFQSSSTTSYTDSSGTRAQHTYSDPSGTTVTSASAAPGERPVYETKEYPRGGTSGTQIGGPGGAERRIEDVTDDAEEDRRAE